MIFRSIVSAILIIGAAGLAACGKEDKKSELAIAEKQKADAAAAEAEKRKGVMSELLTEQQFLDLKIKAAAERLEKQGNKTKKKLKPKFASLEAERSQASSSLEKLKTISEPDFIEESIALRAFQDSLSKTLAGLEKSMK